jgi:alkylation response protein AidB-like acyl-CoA dehydrogenase
VTDEEIMQRLRALLKEELPLPARGQTPRRHARLWAAGLKDLSLARLAEAHWDAVAILAECGRCAEKGAVYGVWASELPGHELRLNISGDTYELSGTKMFCSGAGLVDRALVTVGSPQPLLVEVDLNCADHSIRYDQSAWTTKAFCATHTGAVTFDSYRVDAAAIIERPNWYLDRPGFWHGACGPAACWAGGADGLLQYAIANRRQDAHTLAHLAAMHSSVWAMRSCLEAAGREIDAEPDNYGNAHIRALTVRHLIEQHCTDILRRFARAYGPYPLSMDADISQRYQELDLYLRQSHAERDLEQLGRHLREERRVPERS